MKKAILTILAGALFMTSACANPSKSAGNTVVCYFSNTGNTKVLAETTAKALNADIFEIVPEVPYTADDLNWHNSNSRSSVECNDSTARPAIKTKGDLSKYDTVILAFPIWWSTAPKIMWTFVEQNDLSGKNVVAICTSGSSGISGAEKDLKAHASSFAKWKNGARFSSSTKESEIKNYFEKIFK